jgi:hypothetical protein
MRRLLTLKGSQIICQCDPFRVELLTASIPMALPPAIEFGPFTQKLVKKKERR